METLQVIFFRIALFVLLLCFTIPISIVVLLAGQGEVASYVVAAMFPLIAFVAFFIDY